MTHDNKYNDAPDGLVDLPHLFLGDELFDESGPSDQPLEQIKILRDRVNKLEKINLSLIYQVERNMNQQATGYSLFQSAILLEEQVRARTVQLRTALNELEITNTDLSNAKEQAEHSNRSKTRFLAGASHDLLQPLSAARLNLSALGTVDLSQQAGKLIGQVDRSLQTIEELLRTLFDISKLDAGVSVPDICRFSSERIMRGLMNDFAAHAKMKGLKFIVRPSTVIVETDPIFLRRILQNLVSNALRYTRDGGVLIGARKRGDHLCFQVWDTGTGIPDYEHDRIFEEFHRCRQDVHQDGLGLGLAIVQRMAEAAGHIVDFRSIPDKGSMFSVTVPICAQQSSLIEAVSVKGALPPQMLRLQDAFIALIEDDPSVCEAMERLISSWGAKCLTSDCWPGIRQHLNGVERAPDLVIADYHLSDETVGPDVIKNIRRLYKSDDGREIPGLIVTATPSPKILNVAAKMDCEFMTKPVEPAELRALSAHLINC